MASSRPDYDGWRKLLEPAPDMGRRIRLWERRAKDASKEEPWEPVTFHEMIAGLGGGYGRAAALAIELMVEHGEPAETEDEFYRFRSEEERRKECEPRRTTQSTVRTGSTSRSGRHSGPSGDGVAGSAAGES